MNNNNRIVCTVHTQKAKCIRYSKYYVDDDEKSKNPFLPGLFIINTCRSVVSSQSVTHTDSF